MAGLDWGFDEGGNIVASFLGLDDAGPGNETFGRRIRIIRALMDLAGRCIVVECGIIRVDYVLLRVEKGVVIGWNWRLARVLRVHGTQ